MKRQKSRHLKMILLVFISALLLGGMLSTGCTHKSEKTENTEKSENQKKMGNARDLMNKGDFVGALQSLSATANGGGANNATGGLDVSFLQSVCQVALGQKPDFRLLTSLQPKERYYVLSLLAVLKPQTTLEYLHSRPSVDAQEAEFAIIAMKLQKLDRASIQKQESTWLFPPAAFEKSIQDVKIPDRSEPPTQFHEDVKVLVAKTQAIRRDLRKETANRPAAVQLRILEADKKLEQQVATFIQQTPGPAGMTGPKLASYKMGLNNISKEFSTAADDISKREAVLNDRLKQAEQSSAPARPDMGPDLKKWPWPQGVLTGENGFDALSKSIADKNFNAAIVLADLLRSGPLKNNDPYYAVRAGVLLMVSSDDPMRSFVFDELTRANQAPLIAQWQGITAKAAPSSP